MQRQLLLLLRSVVSGFLYAVQMILFWVVGGQDCDVKTDVLRLQQVLEKMVRKYQHLIGIMQD